MLHTDQYLARIVEPWGNLDAGGSSTLFYNGKVQNRPCDGSERPVANALVVVKAKQDVAQSDVHKP